MNEKRDRSKKIVGRPIEELIYSPGSRGSRGRQKNNKDSPIKNELINEVFKNNEYGVFRRSLTKPQIINIPFMLINESLGQIVERFSICDCDECLSAITYLSLENLQSENIIFYVRVNARPDEDLVNELLEKYRPTLRKILAKIAMDIKKKPIHEPYDIPSLEE